MLTTTHPVGRQKSQYIEVCTVKEPGDQQPTSSLFAATDRILGRAGPKVSTILKGLNRHACTHLQQLTLKQTGKE